MGYAIYTITNTTSGTVYVGCTAIEKTEPIGKYAEYAGHPRRYGQHLYSLSRHEHYNERLQAEWDTHSPADFEWNVIEVLPAADLPEARAVERQWITAFPEVYNIKGLNGRFGRMTPLPEGARDEVVDRLMAGELGKDIAKDLGISEAMVSVIKKQELPWLPRFPKGYVADYGPGRANRRRAQYEAAMANAVMFEHGDKAGTVNIAATARRAGMVPHTLLMMHHDFSTNIQ